jgi:hypothetical protein
VDYHKPFAVMVVFDTNLPLSMRAIVKLINFVQAEDAGASTPYSQAWARSLPRESWNYISDKLRKNIGKNSHVSF